MNSLRALVQAARAILLDFDGPVCDLFSGFSAREIAQNIRSFLLEQEASLPEPMMSERDPLAFLRWVDVAAPHLLSRVEQLQADSEKVAAGLAEPTPGAAETIRAAAELDLPVVIVTNNSAETVEAYFDRLNLSACIVGISGRVPGRPDLMKPDAHLVLKGAEMAGQPTSACLLIGDSLSDMQAAKKAGARCIGYAKRATKIPKLSEAGADLIVQSMVPVADAMTGLRT